MVCDSCRQRAGILIAVRSESRNAGDWYFIQKSPARPLAATTDFGLRREAKRHAAFGSNRQCGKRCRRYALPPQSKSLSSVREVAGLYYGFSEGGILRSPNFNRNLSRRNEMKAEERKGRRDSAGRNTAENAEDAERDDGKEWRNRKPELVLRARMGDHVKPTRMSALRRVRGRIGRLTPPSCRAKLRSVC